MRANPARQMAGNSKEAAAPRQHRRRWPAIALAAIIIVAALAYAWQTRGGSGDQLGIVAQVQPSGLSQTLATAPVVGKLAPNFRLKTINGQMIRLSDLRGQPVLLNFWATWCPDCREEMPAMQELASTYHGKMQVLGVNVGDDAAKAGGYANAHDIHYTLALDPDMAVSHVYKVTAMPASLFLDRDGIVRYVRYGPMTTAEMTKQLQPLLTG